MSDTAPYYYSPSRTAFFASALRDAYELSGTWPGDGVAVTEQTFQTYGLGAPPLGMTRGADITGQPIWVNLPAPPPPTQAQVAATMLATGIEIVSTSNPTLDGTYPCDPRTNSDDGNLLAAISAGLSLPNGVAVRVDTSGGAHAFLPADFKNYCQAKLIFQQQLNTIIGTNQGALPTQPTVIP